MMLTGYFDDSGHVNSKQALIVSGFVAPVGQWTLFERDWRAVLKRPEFSLDYLHMKEVRSYRGQYKKFKNNLDLETALFKRLHHVIERRAEESFGCIVLLDDWARVNQEYMLEEKIGHPFAFAGTLTIHKTLRWMEKAHPHDFIKFVFDHGTDGWGDFVEKSKERSNVLPVPGTYKEQLPLQAADHVAWEMHRATRAIIDNNFAPGSVAFRRSFDALIRRWEKDRWNWVDESELQKLCRSRHGPIPERHP